MSKNNEGRMTPSEEEATKTALKTVAGAVNAELKRIPPVSSAELGVQLAMNGIRIAFAHAMISILEGNKDVSDFEFAQKMSNFTRSVELDLSRAVGEVCPGLTVTLNTPKVANADSFDSDSTPKDGSGTLFN